LLLYIFTNGNITSYPKSTKKLLNDLAEIKQINPKDLHSWLEKDHTNFSVLSVSAKHIQSTDRLSITLSKNSAQSFYVGLKANQAKHYCQCLTNHQIKLNSNGTYSFCSVNCSLKTWLSPPDNCLTNSQDCLYFQFFNSKEKKLYTRFLDKVEANFEGNQYLEPSKTAFGDPRTPTSDYNPEDPTKTPPNPTEPGSEKPKQHLNSILKNPALRLPDTRPHLFLTLTFNTTNQDYYAWTTSYNPTDPCWTRLDKKQTWLKTWAQSFDPQAEPIKVHIPPVEADVSQYPIALSYLQLFLRRVRRLWKPSNWKWVVVAELQKNGNWHFHLLSTPIVPYSHKCVLDKNFSPCWNCCAYIAKLWPYGRADLRSPGDKSISQYLAKYLSKSFHLRKLYQEHGLKEHSKTYSFFKNLYSYDQQEAILNSKSKLDKLSGQYLNNQQQVFRHYDYATGETTYYYKTNEALVGKCRNPWLLKKNYRLATRALNPLNLLKIAKKDPQKSAYLFQKPKLKPTTSHDFQEFLITRLLLFCKSAEFLHLPLEQDQVPKLKSKCDATVYHHFKPKPILHFKFTPESVPLVLTFIKNLDYYAQEYDTQESQEFYDSRFTDLSESRNAYLNHWQINTYQLRKEEKIYQGLAPG